MVSTKVRANHELHAQDSHIHSVIVSSDIKNLIDDEIHSLLVRPLPKGCRLTVRIRSDTACLYLTNVTY